MYFLGAYAMVMIFSYVPSVFSFDGPCLPLCQKNMFATAGRTLERSAELSREASLADAAGPSGVVVFPILRTVPG